MRIFTAIVLGLLVNACTPEPDRATIAKCETMGHTAGTKDYQTCVREENAAKLMEQQRREYEMMKQNERDWKMRNY